MSNLKFKIYNFGLLKLLLSVLILHFTFYILHSVPVARAQTFSLGIYPPIIEVMVMPGKSVTQTYTLTNSGDETEISTKIVSFKPGDELGNPQLQQSTINSQQSTIGFSFENADLALGEAFVLRTGESKQVILRIAIPAEAVEDDYYFTLLFAAKPASKLDFSGTGQVGVIGSNVLITVSKDGKPVKKGEIAQFKLLDCYFVRLLDWCVKDSFDKPQLLLRVKNTGRTVWQPFGKLVTKGLLGQKWEQALLPDNVLANSVREINTATPSASPPFLIGPYEVKAAFNLGTDGKELTAATSFFALPIKAIIAILTAVLITLTIKKFIKRR